MSSTLHPQVLRAIREHDLLGADDRVAVAISGGPDSVALLWLLTDLQNSGDLPGRLVGLVHVNHQLRGDESNRDEQFCVRLAERAGLPIELGTFDVGARARGAGRSLESTARDVRYAFFTEAATRLAATRVATGHTLDDQAETLLLRLFRGSSRRGLGGIRHRRGIFIRPLLNCRRAALRAFLASRGEPFCDDSSNDCLDIPRNRLRHRLLPVIEELSRTAVPAIARAASLAADDESYLEEQAIKAAGSIVLITGDGVQLNAGGLSGLPAAIGRRVLRRALEGLAPGRPVSARHLEALRRMCTSAPRTAHLDLSGVVADTQGGCLHLRTAVGRPAGRPRGEWQVALPVPGDAPLGLDGACITASRRDRAAPDELAAGGDEVVVQEAAIRSPLVVRSRRPGDRVRPLGAPGRRKLQDVLVDRKIPRDERDFVPLVVDADGRIVWVAGVTIAEECRVTKPDGGVVVLKLERAGRSHGEGRPRLKGIT